MILARNFNVVVVEHALRRVILVAPCKRSAARGNEIPPQKINPVAG